MRTVAQSELGETAARLLQEAKGESIVICENDRELGALISMEDYKIMREAKVKNFLAFCDELSDKVARQAEKEGISLEDLEKELLAD